MPGDESLVYETGSVSVRCVQARLVAGSLMRLLLNPPGDTGGSTWRPNLPFAGLFFVLGLPLQP